jgi:integrase
VAGERIVSAAVTLAARVEQYLAERRRLGFSLRTMSYSLRSLVEHVRKTRHRGALTVELMAAWARQARRGAGTPTTWARCLRRLRPFTRWLQQFEPATEVPEESIFGPIPGRLAPHIYRDEELIELLQAAGRLGPRSSPRAAVMQTLFGLLACCGMRISEALALTDADVDLNAGLLTIRHGKFGKSRLVPLHPSATAALRRYRRERDRYVRATPHTPLFIATRGRRFGQPFGEHQVHRIFDQLRRALGWTGRGAHGAPRIHDLRHSFAVKRLLLWHQQGVDLDQRMLALSTYLGHVKVSSTYWYFTAVPELMAIAGKRFEHFADPWQERGEDDDA